MSISNILSLIQFFLFRFVAVEGDWRKRGEVCKRGILEWTLATISDGFDEVLICMIPC